MEQELIISSSEPTAAVDTTTCPYCAETILAAAIKCKHCKEMLVKAADTAPAPIVESKPQPQILAPSPEVAPSRRRGLFANWSMRRLLAVFSIGAVIWSVTPMYWGIAFVTEGFLLLVLLDILKRVFTTTFSVSGRTIDLRGLNGVTRKQGRLTLLGNCTWEDRGSQGRRKFSTIEIGEHEVRGLAATDYLSTHLSNAVGSDAELYVFLGSYVIGVRYNNKMYSDMSILCRYCAVSAVLVPVGIGAIFLFLAFGALVAMAGEKAK